MKHNQLDLNHSKYIGNKFSEHFTTSFFITYKELNYLTFSKIRVCRSVSKQNDIFSFRYNDGMLSRHQNYEFRLSKNERFFDSKREMIF